MNDHRTVCLLIYIYQSSTYLIQLWNFRFLLFFMGKYLINNVLHRYSKKRTIIDGIIYFIVLIN
jgi:hypothetical protein